MKRLIVPVAIVVSTAAALAAGSFVTKLKADDVPFFGRFEFQPDSLVLSRSVYAGNASTVTVGQVLPPGCVAGKVLVYNVSPAGSTTAVTVPEEPTSGGCGTAVSDGEYPNLKDSSNVWNNDAPDGSFGVTSPIYLDNIDEDGNLLGTLPVSSSQLVTSFSSKSELALNRSADKKTITFGAYQGGPGCPKPVFAGTPPTAHGPVSLTSANLLDVSNSNTPGVCDETNPVVSSDNASPSVPTAYYRAVAEVNADGSIQVTDNNAYSGNNGRAAIKGSNGMYYQAGNDNNGNLSKAQLSTTVPGVQMVNSTGVELVVPGQTAPVPPNINKVGDFEVTQVGYATADKAGKDNNFRGLTIFNNTLYVTKGSGGNGINTVYQVGTAGVLPTPSNAPGGSLLNVPITILPGFPTGLASGVNQSGAATPVSYPFGIWFANSSTLYVCDEGDGTYVPPTSSSSNVADASELATAGLQKWSLVDGTWVLDYTLQDGLNIGVPYGVKNYPTSINPATGGCRNITGYVDPWGTVTVWAVTSTISANGDQGADPNKLVRIKDQLSAKTKPSSSIFWWEDDFEKFVTIRTANAGEVLRGISLAPRDDDRDDQFFGGLLGLLLRIF